MEIPEFTCLCPRTGQPDFATLTLDYVPDQRCVELKSLKLYVWSYRNQGAFHEAVANRILDDLVRVTRPRFMRLTAKFYVRGGIFTTVVKMPPRTLNFAVSRMKRGRVAFTRSSRMRWVTASWKVPSLRYDPIYSLRLFSSTQRRSGT